MSSKFGNRLQFSLFGESHSAGIGGVLDGFPEGKEIDFEKLESFLERRRPGQSSLTTSRKEEDQVEFLSGIYNGITTGSPIGFIIRNKDARSKDYEKTKYIPRPGHADFTAEMKFSGYQDKRGGGHFSGRLTAPFCVAGGLALQELEQQGITISTKILEVYGQDENFEEIIEEARKEQDSVGGIIQCRISGLEAGVGGYKSSGIEGRLAGLLFSAIPAIKGLEFGLGFETTRKKGSEVNDEYEIIDGRVRPMTNHSGGVLGGISTGADIVFQLAIKPTPSIGKNQQSVNLQTLEEVELEITGRHDPSIVLRICPVIEAVAAFGILDILLED